jgi:hypothetical protein
MKSLVDLLNAVTFLSGLIKSWLLFQRKKDIKDAASVSLNTNDQRPLENSLGGHSDTDIPNYDGMSTHEPKKRP